jgi:hypothetical protein
MLLKAAIHNKVSVVMITYVPNNNVETSKDTMRKRNTINSIF